MATAEDHLRNPVGEEDSILLRIVMQKSDMVFNLVQLEGNLLVLPWTLNWSHAIDANWRHAREPPLTRIGGSCNATYFIRDYFQEEELLCSWARLRLEHSLEYFSVGVGTYY